MRFTNEFPLMDTLTQNQIYSTSACTFATRNSCSQAAAPASALKRLSVPVCMNFDPSSLPVHLSLVPDDQIPNTFLTRFLSHIWEVTTGDVRPDIGKSSHCKIFYLAGPTPINQVWPAPQWCSGLICLFCESHPPVSISGIDML